MLLSGAHIPFCDVINYPVKGALIVFCLSVDVQYIFLVGGLSESPVLQHATRDKFGTRAQVLVPQEASLAVLKGYILHALFTLTLIRRPFDCLSKVIKVTVTYNTNHRPAGRSHAELFVYLGRSAAAQTWHGRWMVVARSNCSRIVVVVVTTASHTTKLSWWRCFATENC